MAANKGQIQFILKQATGKSALSIQPVDALYGKVGIGQSFQRGNASGVAGQGASVSEWEIVGFAPIAAYCFYADDRCPLNEWADDIKNDPAAIVVKEKGWERYEIFTSREVSWWLYEKAKITVKV